MELAKLVGTTIGLYPNQVANLLNKSGVTVNAEKLPFDKLIDATISGLSKSPSFLKDFEAFFNANEETIIKST